MYWLVLYMISSYGVATTVIPEKYSTLEACHAAAKADKWQHSCLPAETPKYIDNITIVIPTCIAPDTKCKKVN